MVVWAPPSALSKGFELKELSWTSVLVMVLKWKPGFAGLWILADLVVSAPSSVLGGGKARG